MYDEYIDRVGEVVTGIVQQAGDRNNVLIDLGKVEALLPRSEQVDGERYEQGSRIKAVITEVRSGTKGPQVILSRRDPELIRTLFELEVPEIADGLVEIRARRPRAGLPLEDRRRVARPGRRPGRRLRRPARLARAHGRLRAARREDRHHPVEHGAGTLRREGAVARARARGLHRRRHEGGDGGRPRRPARARDRQGGPERPPRRTPVRLEDRHRVRHGVRPGGGRGRLRRREEEGESSAAAPRSSRPASAARTPRCPARGSAACPRTRSSPSARRAARTSPTRSCSPRPRQTIEAPSAVTEEERRRRGPTATARRAPRRRRLERALD